MQKTIDLVLDWRSTFGLIVDGGGSESDIALSESLIDEEFEEYRQAVLKEDKIEQLDAIGDLFFVMVQLECMYRKPTYESTELNQTIERVFIPNFGNVTIEHDPNLDYEVKDKDSFEHFYTAIELLPSQEDNSFSRVVEVLSNLSKQLNVDFHDLVQEIYNSNMSKLCKDEQTAQETVENYKKKGVETYYKTCTTDSSKYIVYRSEDNKVLKSVDFVEPNIKKLLE